jgi:hypothetical protein
MSKTRGEDDDFGDDDSPIFDGRNSSKVEISSGIRRIICHLTPACSVVFTFEYCILLHLYN